MANRHDIFWASPVPLWSNRLDDGRSGAFERPARLEFQQDEYVRELTKALAGETASVEQRLVNEPTLDGDAHPVSDSTADPLYQPMHGRYYTVSASLVCRRRGLPDRQVRVVEDEQVGAVIRRLRRSDPDTAIDLSDRSTYVEYGWAEGAWVRLEDQTTVDAFLSSAAEEHGGETESLREKRYRMFPKPYDSNLALERSSSERRVWNALVPVTEREDFLSAPMHAGGRRSGAPLGPSSEAADTENGSGQEDPFWERNVDPRRNIFQAEVLEPLADLHKYLDPDSDVDEDIDRKSIAAPLAFAIFDLWKFLDSYFRDVGRWLAETPRGRDPAGHDAPFTGKVKALLVHLSTADFPVNLAGNWLDAVRSAEEVQEALRRGEYGELVSEGQADAVSRSALRGGIEALVGGESDGGGGVNWSDDVTKSSLYSMVARALREEGKSPTDPKDELDRPIRPRDENAVFLVRCVYERPRCTPYFEPVVSTPTAPFRLASVMDLDAPARDHRFAMPDVGGPEDLRDTDKGVSVVLTEKLNAQIERVKGATMNAIENQNVGDEGPGIALVCRLSIPIISICALVLLIVMVNLLNFIFWWLPYFMICFPLPTRD